MIWTNRILIALSTFLVILATTVAHADTSFAPSKGERPLPAQFLRRNDALDAWLDRLIQKESSGSSTVIIVDTNGYRSYGCLQFQRATWDRYSKKFNFEGDILNCEDQKFIARRMLEDNPSAWTNWWTSVVVKELGLPPL